MAATIQNIELPKKPRALDTSGNNNHGKIYSGRALEFDGVTDYLTRDASFLGDLSQFTMSAWLYFPTAPTADYGTCFYIGTEAFNHNQPYAAFVLGTTDSVVTFGINQTNGGSRNVMKVESPTLNTSTWYRFVGVYDGVSDEILLYINGSLIGTYDTGDQSTFNDGHASGKTVDFSSTTKLLIGGGPSGHLGAELDIHVSDTQFWDASWTAADVAYDYANPESLALNASGTALTEGNLKLWYPMQDGHRGQQSYILDGANTGLGVELVTNGDFATDSSWSKGTGILIEDGVCKFNGNNNVQLSQDIGLVTGAVYKTTFTISNYESGELDVNIGGNTRQGDYTANGTYEVIEASDSGSSLFFQEKDDAGGFVGHLDNVSCKRINDKHHATTVFYGDELIEAYKDKTFGSSSNWVDSSTTANQWTQDSGEYDEDTASGADESTALTAYDGRTVTFADNYLKLVATSDGSDLRLANLDGGSFSEGSMTVGRTYRLSYAINITSFTSGSFSVGFGATDIDTDATRTYASTRSASADYFDFVYEGSTTHAKLFLRAATNSVFTVYLDNFSLKEVGVATGWTDADQQLDIAQPALQSYNELAWWPGTDPGTDLEVDCGSHSSIDDIFDGGGTISAWVFINSSGAGDRGRILDKNKWYFYLYGVSSGACKLKFFADTNSANHTLVTDAFDVKLGQWNHVALTYDSSAPGTASKMYLNGVLLATTATGSGTNVSDAASNLRIGNNIDGDRTFGGSITGVSLHSTAINASKVLEIYNEGKELDMTTFSGYSAVEGYWRNNGLSTWKNTVLSSTTKLLGEELTNSETEVDVDADHGFVANDVVVVGSEEMLITSVATNTLTVVRGYNDTTATTHDDDSAISVYKNGTVNNITETLLIPQGVDGSRDAQGFIMNKPRNTSCLNLDGIVYGQVGNFEDSFDFGTTAFTVQAWVKPRSLAADDRIVTKGTTDAAEWMISVGVDNASVRVFAKDSGGVQVDTGNTFSTLYVDTWAMITVVIDTPNDQVLFYKDDGSVETKSFSGWSGNFNGSAPLRIGANEALGAARFDGQVDGLLVFNKALSATEKTRNYKATKGSHRN